MTTLLDKALESLLTKAIKSKITQDDIDRIAERVAPKLLEAVVDRMQKEISKNSMFMQDYVYDVLTSKDVSLDIIKNITAKLNAT